MKTPQYSREELILDARTFKEGMLRAHTVAGDFVELGVFEGKAFVDIIYEAREQGKKAHAIDSFCGFAKPTEKDIEPSSGETLYPEGLLDPGGSSSLWKQIQDWGYQEDEYAIWEGFVPEVLDTIPDDVRVSFAYVDLDHYEPTVHALEWVWDRLSPQGIVICDDFFEIHSWGTASLAITEFISKHVDEFDILVRSRRRITFKKRGTAGED